MYLQGAVVVRSREQRKGRWRCGAENRERGGGDARQKTKKGRGSGLGRKGHQKAYLLSPVVEKEDGGAPRWWRPHGGEGSSRWWWPRGFVESGRGVVVGEGDKICGEGRLEKGGGTECVEGY